jgi:two-component system, cell cycle response regulator DivK
MKKILIVEDNSDYREILALFMTKMGYQPIQAKNSYEAVMFAEAEEPDLIFMDMQLPDIDGVNTTAMLKQNPKTSRIPIVALTAWMSALSEEKASKVGIATYWAPRDFSSPFLPTSREMAPTGRLFIRPTLKRET